MQKSIEEVTKRLIPDKEFLSQLERWIQNQPLLKKFYGEEIASINLCHSITPVKGYLCNHLNKLRTDWIKNRNLSVLKKVKDIRDVDAFLQAIQSTHSIGSTNKLIEYWETNIPENGEDLAWWNIRANKRIGFAQFLIDKLQDSSMDSG